MQDSFLHSTQYCKYPKKICFNQLRCVPTLQNIWFTDSYYNLNFIFLKERAMCKISGFAQQINPSSGLRSLLEKGGEICEYIKIHWLIYIKWVNCVVCELYLNKAVAKKKKDKNSHVATYQVKKLNIYSRNWTFIVFIVASCFCQLILLLHLL